MNLEIRKIREACLASAGPDTAYRFYSTERSKLFGHCGPVSYTVQKLLGGDLLSARLYGETHYWNRLPDGTQIDLTSCQFPDGDGFTPVYFCGRKVPPRKTTNPRFIEFYNKVTQLLQ